MIIKYYCHTGRPTLKDYIKTISVDPRPEKFTLGELPNRISAHFKSQHEMILSTRFLDLSEKINAGLTNHDKKNTDPSKEEKDILGTLCCFDFIGIEYTDGHNEERILGPDPTIYIMNDRGDTIDKIRNGMDLTSAYNFYKAG